MTHARVFPDEYVPPRYSVDEPPSFRQRCSCGWVGPERYMGVDVQDHARHASADRAPRQVAGHPVTWTTNHGDRVEVYSSEVGNGTLARPLEQGWRWRVVARNNRILEQGEGHPSRRNAVRAALRHHPRVEVES